MGNTTVFVARSARAAIVGLIAGALVFSGTGVALAEEEPATTPGAEASAQPDDGTTATPEVSTPAGEAAQPEQPAQETPVSPSPAAEEPDAGTTVAPEDDTSVLVTTPESAPDEGLKAPDGTRAPALRWRLVDEAGKPVAGVTVMVQGPRDPSVTDLGNDEPWVTAPKASVKDNIGAADYAGDDLDPAPGVFRVESFADDGDEQAVSMPVLPEHDYRMRAIDAEGFAVGDDALWASVAVIADESLLASDIMMTPPPVASREAIEIAPMLVGPDGPGVATPYVYWSVKDSNGTLVGGASFNIQGPRDNSNNNPSWTANSATIVDNGPGDLDPDNGEFLVQTIGTHTVSTTRRYRVQQAQAPAGYRFTQTTSWIEMTGNRQTAGADQWPGDRHDFGTFVVETLPSMAPVCTPGNVYAISQGGQLQRIAGGTRTNVGTSAGQSSMNGLGIGAGGSTVYAMNRTDDATDANIYTFNTTTGVWSSTGHSQATSVSLVAGAVNLNTGAYVFGGYTSNGSEFHLWRYNAGSGTFTKLGYIQTNMGSGSNNGDIAFNAAGDLFVIHGRGSAVTVFSVTAANFNAASGGVIAASQSATITTSSSDVNGIAFDASGKGYLGSSSQLRSYDMPAWTNSALVTSNLDNSTDLASCSSPATIKLQKVVQGRAVSTDQFTLTLQQGSTVLGTTTTSGSATGVQPQVVGPLPVVRGATLTFAEAFAGGAQASNYATSYQCLVDGQPMSPAVTGTTTSGSITIPSVGEAIVCEFVNSPLTASVSISKAVQDAYGQNAAPAAGWTVNAATTATSGSVTRSPANSQQTNGAGVANWGLTFGTPSARATVTVSETQQTGYQFVSGTCTITPPVGDPLEVTLSSAAPQALTGVAPGSRVDCAYVNKQIASSISWEKISNDAPATHLGGSTWTLQGPGAGGATITVADCVGASASDCATVADKDARAGYLRVENLGWGQYTLVETVAPQGFQPDTTPRTITITAANAVAGASTAPVVNARILGTATWTKVVTGTTTRLGGSEWTLTGPGMTAPGNVVRDCIETTDAACTGLDRDRLAGQFRIVDLAWGNYTLVESSAPLGYLLDTTPHTFSVNATTQHIVVGTFENTLAPPPTLPLTGGLGRDFYAFLGLGVLLLSLTLFTTRRLWARTSHDISA